ncbi:MAG: adenosine kinase [Gammaproteobacteria bacterium]|nr:adenosine kinase [Gammaproteobacteria bacterium]
MKNYHVYGVGNALVDTEYEVEESFLADFSIDKGLMTLIDEQTKLHISHHLDRRYSAKKHTGGGSAANTMVALAQFGGKVFYSCKVADDEIGRFYMNDLHKVGVVTKLGSQKHDGITGQCLVMVTPDAERTMTTFLGITQDLSVAELDAEALALSDYLYIEGYLVSSNTGKEAAVEARKIARQAGVKVSLTLSDPAMVDNFKDAFDEIIDGQVDLLFCNKEEALIWTAATDVEAAAESLKKEAAAFAITLGGDGSLIYDGKKLSMVAPQPVQAIDTNGAGDMFAGAFLYGITHGYSFIDAAILANKSAASLVSKFGARMDPESQRSLITE